VLGGLGAAAAGGLVLPGVPAFAGVSSASRESEWARAGGAATLAPAAAKRLRLPAASFRPTSSAAAWTISGGTLQAAGPATYTAPVVPTAFDLLEELLVVVDPGGQTGAITLSRYQPGVVEDLVAGTYPATSGVTTVSLPLPNRPHVADPATSSYAVTIAMTTGVVLHSAAIDYLAGSATVVLIDPVRVWDSRDPDPYKLVPGVSGSGKLAGGSSLGFSLQGVVPTYNRGALVNVTLDQTEGSGYLVVYGPGESGQPPPTSNINWYTANQIVANLVATTLGSEASLAITAGGPGRTHVIVDVVGYLL
jgi:hypothetical protein